MDNLQDSVLINQRRVTIIKPGQFLTKPCVFCQIRSHKQDNCPHQPQYAQPKQILQEKDIPALATAIQSHKPTDDPPNHEALPKNNQPISTTPNTLLAKKKQIEVNGENLSEVFLINSSPESSGNLERLCQTAPIETVISRISEHDITDLDASL